MSDSVQTLLDVRCIVTLSDRLKALIWAVFTAGVIWALGMVLSP